MNRPVEDTTQLNCADGDPGACFQRWRRALQAEEALLVVHFRLELYWLEHAPPLELAAIYCVDGEALEIAVTEHTLVAEDLPPRQQYVRWLRRHQLLSYTVGNPIQLAIQRIAKPWGEEIWYTGVEHRGVCNFSREGRLVPIPWLQAALPGNLAGPIGEPLLLLKILAPSALPVLGDLYFELHQTKREVYVVTHIDAQAWPDGIGYIRYGFNPQQRAAYGSDDAFRKAFLERVLAYQEQRRKLDNLAEQGGQATPQDHEREQFLRRQMEQFTQLLPLQVGDVVHIPPLFPHALQHGVRTVEFQTPGYERKIISFAQKVQTQEDWDTREAVPMMLLEPPPLPPARVLPGSGKIRIEGVAEFPDFNVVRVSLPPGASWAVDAMPHYSLLMVLSGTLAVSGALYEAEQALLLPRSWCGVLAVPETASTLVFLLAKPRS